MKPDYHIYPLNDLREHEFTHNGECWCDPQIEYGERNVLCVHNSLDGREKYERRQRKPH